MIHISCLRSIKSIILWACLATFIVASCKKDAEITLPNLENDKTTWFTFNNSEDTILDLVNTAQHVWGATKNSGLFKVDKKSKTIEYFNVMNSGIPENDLTSIAVDKDSRIWLGTSSSGLLAYDGTSWVNHDTINSALPSNQIRSIAVNENNTVWVGTSNGLAALDENGWTNYSTNSGLPGNIIRRIKNSPTNILWLGTQTGGIGKFENNDWENYNLENSVLVDNYIRLITFGLNSDIWVASGRNFYRFSGASWIVNDKSNSGISSNYVNDIAVSNKGIVYFGTHDGFCTYDGFDWKQFYTTNSDLPDNIVERVVIDESGNKWVGTFAGLVIYNESGIDL